jgi:glycine/D-amino acid oxidase-like deaminating enzyme
MDPIKADTAPARVGKSASAPEIALALMNPFMAVNSHRLMAIAQMPPRSVAVTTASSSPANAAPEAPIFNMRSLPYLPTSLAFTKFAIIRPNVPTAGEETGWRRTGITYLCYNKRDMEIWGGWYEKGKAYGLSSEMLTGSQVEALLPGSSGGLIGGLHTPSDGRAEPALATIAMANAARRAGAHILTQCAARGVERSTGKISAVVTERGRITCSSVVLAGGVWSRLFAGNMGVDFPQLKVMGTVARVTGIEGIADMPVGAGDFAYRKRLDGDYSVALRNANIANIVPDSFRLFAEYMPSFIQTWRELKLRVGKSFIDELVMPRRWALDEKTAFEAIRTLDPQPTKSFNRKALANLARAFPAFARARVVNEWAGMMDVTPDAVPVISDVPSTPGFFIASGFSGHGFGIGPGAGHLMADIVMGGDTLVDPAPFHISRLRPKSASAA